MKVRINISISEEANSILNKQSNKSQYLEDLILNQQPIKPISPSYEDLEDRITNIVWGYVQPLETRIETLESNFGENIPDIPAPTCCLSKTTPCKHWEWDGLKEQWINKLTGEVRYA